MTNTDKLLMVALFLVVMLATLFSRNGRLYSTNVFQSEESVDLYLEERENLYDLARAIEEQQLTFDRKEFLWAARTLGWRTFSPGRYLIEPGLSYDQFFSKLGRGLQDPVRVTILPGIDVKRLSASLHRQLRSDSSAFLDIFSDSSAIALENNMSSEELFSRMLPETYEMYWTSEPQAVVDRVLRAFQIRVKEGLAEEIKEHSLSLEEVVTLASIVEWEARYADEKRRIAGLYTNRLERNMPLQADPTVIYAIGERRRLLYEDYRIDHPYNTYLIRGLPPGPITNPDLQSIRAVLNPEEHDYLYMVATPEGRHRFSETFQEHREASEEWRRWIREQYRIKRERERAEQQGSSGSS
ncbi:MAG: endolytic transglycosylase MltG [Bacteroidetes bacterium]|jgi:UPF0755 protein|nr:endolytic transglycosylase MltG [Bacteroidota bacterium]